MKKVYLIMILALLAVGQTAQAAVLDSCDQWASYCSGGYCVYNGVWDPQERVHSRPPCPLSSTNQRY